MKKFLSGTEVKEKKNLKSKRKCKEPPKRHDVEVRV